MVSCLARLLCRTNRIFLRSSKKGIGSLWAYPFAYNTTFALFVKSKVQNLHYQKSLHLIFWLFILETNFYCQVIIKFLSTFYQVFIKFLYTFCILYFNLETIFLQFNLTLLSLVMAVKSLNLVIYNNFW